MTTEGNRRIRVKICGLTRAIDVCAAVEAGADALGFVFYPASPRAVTVAQARALARDVPPFVSIVALFVDPSVAEVAAVLDALPMALLQFHGQETPEFCRQFHRPYLKAFPARSQAMLAQALVRYPDACGWLVDTPTVQHGGSGEPFDWTVLPPPEARPRPLVLAGGLTAENVAEAIARVRPWAVDVSSGVESAKGIKDRGKIVRFLSAVRKAENDFAASH